MGIGVGAVFIAVGLILALAVGDSVEDVDPCWSGGSSLASGCYPSSSP